MSKKIQFQLDFEEDLKKFMSRNHPNVIDYRIISQTLDPRNAPKGKRPKYNYTLECIEAGEKFENLSEEFKEQNIKTKPIIIGAGPAGLFCAIRLAEYGVPSIIIERGDVAKKRMLHIAKFWRYGEFNPESNVCYGEGGAGLFSDGKLITRIKSPFVKYVMEKFVQFGAPAETAYISNPHLGSNKIRNIIHAISKYLQSKDSTFYYNTRVDEIIFENKKAIGVKLNNGEKVYSDHVILATGHSASEMYHFLNDQNVGMKAKDFAVGVRVEHLRSQIDRIQHGQFCESPILGAARYKLTYHDKKTDHGIYSFCMCPGGYVLSSGTESDGIVVNGMSNYSRNSHWSNSALVVSVKSGIDTGESVMAGLDFQHAIEKKAYEMSITHATGKELPAMYIDEFLSGKLTDRELPKTSCPSKVFKADFRKIFPKFVIDHLVKGLENFETKMPGFTTTGGILIAPETRTSAPITIERHKETLVSLTHAGLYPCGEGAGYAGGITSAAVDGVKVAESIIQSC